MNGVARKLAATLAAAAGLSSHVWMQHQVDWIEDKSPAAIWEKSRRVGADYAESYRAVAPRISGERTCDYWYSSADESAAIEFAQYIEMWLRLINKVGQVLINRTVDDGDGWLKMSFELPMVKGRRPRITVMTSSPKRFRSKGGDVTLSEFAFHQFAPELWKAATPVTTWGGQIRVISSHNGHDSLFNQLVMQARKHEDPELYGEPKATDFKASVHRTDIYDAIANGLVERINEVAGLELNRDEFLAGEKAKCATLEVWEEEYECIPSKQGGSYFPHALLTPCVRQRSATPTDDLDTFIANIKARSAECVRVSGGCDIGRINDRFVMWVWGRIGTTRACLGVLVWQGLPFDRMEHAITTLMNTPLPMAGGRTGRVSRLCIDATGLGMQLGERMAKKHPGRVEPINMTSVAKEDMFTRLRAGLEEITVELPDDSITLSDISSIRKEVTAAGNVRYSAASNEHGHADRATAAALGLVADESAKAVMRSVQVARGDML